MTESVSSPQNGCVDPGQSRGPGETMEARALRRLAALEELAEMGAELARLVPRQAQERAEAARAEFARPDFARSDVGLVFARIARAVRQTWALHDRLDRERQARADESELQRAARLAADAEKRAAARADMRLRAAVRMNTVREAVETALEARIDEEIGGDEDKAIPEEIHALYEALDERLSDPKDKDEFADLPISQLIARICRDLGVVPDWSLWEDEDWAVEEAEARMPGSPYAPPGFEAAWPETADGGETNSLSRSPPKMGSG
jgi:hypothetical protein